MSLARRVSNRMIGRSSLGALGIASLVLVGSCSSLKGEIANDRYTAPNGAFSFAVPNYAFETMANEEYDEEANAGAISFHGASGGLRSVHYAQVPDDMATVLRDSAGKKQGYSSWLHGVAMPFIFEPVSNQCRILHEEFSSIGGDMALFAIVIIPEGATIIDLKTGKRLDSNRGLLIFFKAGYLYMLSSQIALEGPKRLSEMVTFCKKDLGEFYGTFKFR